MPPISLFDRSVIYEEPLVPRLFRPYQWKKAAAKGMRGSEPSEAERGSELIEKRLLNRSNFENWRQQLQPQPTPTLLTFAGAHTTYSLDI